MEVQGIILAAGLSSRAGTYKMTLELRGRTVIENTIDGMRPFCSRIFVVGGHQIERLRPIMEELRDVELLYNESYLEGMFSSVKKGITAITAPRFFITPGDYPMISRQVYQALLKHKAPVVIPCFEGHRGHPVLMEREAVLQTMADKQVETLRDVIRRLEAVAVPTGCRGVLMDIDTLEDYKMLKSTCVRE